MIEAGKSQSRQKYSLPTNKNDPVDIIWLSDLSHHYFDLVDIQLLFNYNTIA